MPTTTTWNRYECPFCGGTAWPGDPASGLRYRGSGRCDDCGKGFSIVGLKLRPVGTAEFDDRFEAMHPRGPGGKFLSKAVLVGEIDAKIEEAFSRDRLPQDKAEHFRSTMRGVLASLSTGGARLVRDRVAAWHFRATVDEMNRAHRQITSKHKSNARIGGFIVHRDDGRAEVYLDGGSDTGEAGLSADKLTAHTYRHEISHVLDGIKPPRISDGTEWRQAWRQEIDGTYLNVPLSWHAMTNPEDGFAEFGRLVLTDRKLARAKFPLSWAIWKKHHLV